MTPEVELARLEAKKKASWLARFKKDKSNPTTRRGSAVSNATSTGSATAGADKAEDNQKEDSEDLPPRQQHAYRPYDVMETPADSKTAKAASPKDKGVGFDLTKIRAEIAEDDGSGQLPAISSTMGARGSLDMPSPSAASTSFAHKVNGAPLKTNAEHGADLARAPSAPPARPHALGEIGRADTLPVSPTTPTISQPVIDAEKAQRELEAQEEAYERDLQRRLKEEAKEMARVAELEEAEERRRQQSQIKPSAEYGNNPFAASSDADFGDFSSSSTSNLPGYQAFPATSQASLSFAGDDGAISSFEEPSPWTTTNPFQNGSTGGNAWKDPWSGGDAWR